MKKIIFCLCALCLLCGQIPAAIIEAEGRAPGDMKTAREMALADDLREAVRAGTGVDVLSSVLIPSSYDSIAAYTFPKP